MRRYVPYLLGCLLAAGLVGAPVGYAVYRETQARNFRAVRADVLYRSGQPSLPALKAMIHDHGFKTVISLRDGPYPGAAPPDRAEEEYCKAQEITFVRISPTCWGSEEGSVPAEEGVRRFLEVMDDPANYPVLIHCYRGIHRTGIFCAIYHMEYDHWSNARAITDLYESGYENLFEELDVLGYLQDYRPSWKQAPSTEAAQNSGRPTAKHAKRKQKPHRPEAPVKQGA
jgi:protein tyrosine/serine phosphatase